MTEAYKTVNAYTVALHTADGDGLRDVTRLARTVMSNSPAPCTAKSNRRGGAALFIRSMA